MQLFEENLKMRLLDNVRRQQAHHIFSGGNCQDTFFLQCLKQEIP